MPIPEPIIVASGMPGRPCYPAIPLKSLGDTISQRKFQGSFNRRKVQGCLGTTASSKHPVPAMSLHSLQPQPSLEQLLRVNAQNKPTPPLTSVQPPEKWLLWDPFIPFPNELCSSWNPLMRRKQASHIYLDADSKPEVFDDLLIDLPNLVCL